jgi:hypothetical protein
MNTLTGPDDGAAGDGGVRFVRLPERFLARLDRREIGSDHVTVMTGIVRKANYRRRQCVIPTLSALADAIGWERTPQHLRDCLRELRELGELGYEKSQGSRSPYVISIIPDDYFESPRAHFKQGAENGHFKQDTPSPFEVAVGRLKSGQAASAHEQTDSAAPFEVPVGSSPEATAIGRSPTGEGTTQRGIGESSESREGPGKEGGKIDSAPPRIFDPVRAAEFDAQYPPRRERVA